MTVEDRAHGAKDDHDGGYARIREEPLVSVRTLAIMVIAGTVATLVGLAAGIPAGLTTAASAGTGWGVAVGFIAGLAAAAVSGLSMAAGLHSMVGKHL